jgi:hypothetical protein
MMPIVVPLNLSHVWQLVSFYLTKVSFLPLKVLSNGLASIIEANGKLMKRTFSFYAAWVKIHFG